MSDVQNISIISTKEANDPKPHTVYVIQVSTPTRTWTVTRRYNDFVSLHDELKSSTGKEPPVALPPKTWGLGWGKSNDKMIQERKPLLEHYLRSILTTKSSIWRSAYTFSDFLALPSQTSKSSSQMALQNERLTPQSWILEYDAITTLLRSARSLLLKRDALAGMSNASGARSASVEAKRNLKGVEERLTVLGKRLKGLNGVGEGEIKRREEMVEELNLEKQTLEKMAEAGVRTAPLEFAAVSGGSTANAISPWAPSGTKMPGAMPVINPTGRVFGAKQPPQETEQTRPLDDRQLLRLQTSTISQQDDQLRELSQLLQTQKKMGEDIHMELESQNELLDGIEQGVDKTGKKLGKAKREMNRLG
nr:hypothetical protein L204_05735 [Cryptococcus depauperatus CBS 7855]